MVRKATGGMKILPTNRACTRPSRPPMVGVYEGINYWYNRFFCYQGIRLAEVPEPSLTTFILDGPPINSYPHMNWIAFPTGLGYVHQHRAGVQFLDGHAGLVGEDAKFSVDMEYET